MKKKWMVSCRFEKQANAKRYYFVVEAKDSKKALKKAKKAIAWGERKAKAKGFSVHLMYNMPQSIDVWYIHDKEI